MADDVGAPREGLAEIGCRQGVVEDQPEARLMGNPRHLFEIENEAAGIGKVFDEDRLDPRGQRFSGSVGSTNGIASRAFLKDSPNWVSEPP
jgi:hypothetical protein